MDTQTGLQYNRARWLNTNTARFLSEDPIGFAGGDYNLYRYVQNNTTNARDPDGLAPRLVLGEVNEDGQLVVAPPFQPPSWMPGWLADLFEPDPSDFVSTVHPAGAVAGIGKKALGKALKNAAGDIGEKAVGKAAKEAAGVAEKTVSKVWPQHHPFPVYLGGAVDQTLRKIPPKLHHRFHSSLDKYMGGKYARRKSAEYFEGMDKAMVIKDLTKFYKTAEGGVFEKYLPDFFRAVKESGF